MIELHPEKKMPLYEQLYNALAQDIRSGALQPGKTLPGRRTMAAQLGISTNTVDTAYQMLAAEGLAVQLNFLLDLVHADDAGDEQTGRNGRNRHHDRVRQEVEEVEELHPDDRDPRQRAVAQAGQRAQRHHDDADEHRGLFAAPAQLILKR